MNKENFNIAKIIASYLSGAINEEDKANLDTWVQESDSNSGLFEKIISSENKNLKQRGYSKYNKNIAWIKFQNNISKRNIRNIWVNVFKYAAVFLIPFAVGIFLILSKETSKQIYNTQSTIVPGGSKAKLTLADGSVMNLNDTLGFYIEERDGTSINKNESLLSYKKKDDKAINKQIYNIVETPKGGEYVLNLSDGTRVHLNAKSRLKFPVQFIGKKRIVELEGQAYFDVKKDKAHPFIVKTKNLDIRVLGTSFDVSSYSDDENVVTTLVDGTVMVSAKGVKKPIYLKPNDQAVFNKVKRNIGINKVDARYYTAWKDGVFKFRDQRIEDIMNILARWYNVDVYFQNSATKDLKFGCNVNKYDSIEPLLKIFESTEKIKIEVNKKSIIIKQAR